MSPTGPRSPAPAAFAEPPSSRIVEHHAQQAIELELSTRPDAPAPNRVRNRLVRPGLWMHWGPQRFSAADVLPAGESSGAVFIAYAIEGHWRERYVDRDSDFLRAAGQMAVIRSDSLRACLTLPGPAYHVTLALSPAALAGLLGGDDSAASLALRRFAGDAVTPEITLPLAPGARLAAESIRRCPFAGASRGLALSARCHDLLTEFLTAFATFEQPASPAARLALRNTEEQVRAAAQLLRRDLEHPPSLGELARTVGLSESTLKRGFHQLFNTTPFGYHRACRMEAARQLLEQGEANVVEAAAFVGYSNPSNFAAAFRRQFGVNPKLFQLHARR